ncbi:RNA polymerase-binding protein DksA [Solimonas marina]|uniref:RNA polymerase-binding protein DksA n=1 Tax=Solimonas marina TaxID=2714601 RepID=UPI00344F362A
MKPKTAAPSTAVKKNTAAKKPTPPNSGQTHDKLQRVPAGNAALTAAKTTTRSSTQPTVKKSSGNVTVQEKGKSPKKAAAAASNTPTTKTKAARAASKVKQVTRAPGALLTEDDLREMSEDDYMNDAQLEFFRTRLLQMREEVLQRELEVKERLHEREVFADPADRATAEEEHWLDLRLRERESLLLKKIDDALRRIEGKDYGYCEKTGDPIGIPRLLARPTATVCVDIKGQDERVEAQFRDR